MASRFASTALTSQIESLLARREEHQSTIEAIDETLEKIGSMLQVPGRPGRPKGSKNGVAAVRASKGSRRRKRGSFAVSGDESILAFVKKAGTPTTKDVNNHWKSEGRGGTADNALTKLVKLKKIKRLAAKEGRGSRYTAE